MRLIVKNTKTVAVVGGSDNLLDIDIIKELRAYLRVRPTGYNMNTLYRRGKWDGWRYFITPKGTFATGFLPTVYKYLRELGVKVTIQDERANLPKLSSDFSTYVGYIGGEHWEGRPEQIEMVKKVNNYIDVGYQMYFPRGILDCATNAGKTSMAALIVNNLSADSKVVFMVSSKLIYKQAVEFFSQVISEPVGEVKAGKVNFKWFTVCMVKSLLNAAKKDINVKATLAKVQVLIVDESDESGASTYSKTLTLINAGMKVFVSGTPLDSPNKVNKMIQIGLSGPVLGRITKRQLIDLGRSQEPIIKILLNTSKPVNFPTYREEKYHNIQTSQHRMDIICNELETYHLDKPILITFVEKVHGFFMVEYLQKRFPELTISILYGEMKDVDRNDVLDRYKAGKIDIMVCSMVVKRGANIPNIRVLVMAQGGKSKTTVKQISGRGERHDGANDEFYLYDIYDTGNWVSKHSIARIKTYVSEELKVTIGYPHKKYIPIL